MGNTHVCFHRLPAFSTAVLASIACGFLVTAGTTCDFLTVSAPRGELLEYTTEDGIRVDQYSAQFGIVCETAPLFERDGDALWTMSYYFWIGSIGVGALAVLLAWALMCCIGPTDRNWKFLSLLSGISAVLQAPIFLILAAQPCENGNVCEISTGCILLMISTIFWITLTLLTQCQDPPLWAHELDAWRVQKAQQEGMPELVPRRYRESKWQRWTKRRKWATLGLSKTESGSLNGGGPGAADADGRLELMENGSYYADSNNSRLMLKVLPDGTRPGDDGKSVTTFGDLEDMVRYAEDERKIAPLLGQQKGDDDDDPSLLLGEGFVVGEAPKELMIIHSHEDAPLYSSHHTTEGEEEGKTESRGLLEDALLASHGNSSSSSCMPLEGRIVKITGLRALAGRMRSKRTLKTSGGYAQLDDDGGHSDADDEDEMDNNLDHYGLPMTPERTNKPSQQSEESPVINYDPHNQELLNDWNALHAAATAGILLPTSKSMANSVGEREDEEPEPAYYTSEESHSEISLTSFGDEYPDDEELGSTGMSGGSSISSGDSYNSSDNSGDDANSYSRRGDKKMGRRRRAFSATNSVASRRSLLELTIEEETDGDLMECGSSGDDKKKKLADAYPLRGVKSAPDRVGFEAKQQTEGAYSLRKVESYSVVRDLEIVSEDDVSHLSEMLRITSGVQPVTPVETSEEEISELNTSTESDLTSGGSPAEGTESPTRRGRSLSLPRRKVHPITPPQTRGKSATPRFRDERVAMAGIHGPAINLVSDNESSTDDDDGDSSSLCSGNRSLRSTVSRRARNARMKRLHEDSERRRAKSTPAKRRSKPKPEQPIIFDPTLRAILVTRQVGVEYGPDEASL